MKPADNFLAGIISVVLIFLSIAALGVYFYQSTKPSTSKDIADTREIVPPHLLEKGKVLSTCFAKGTKVLMKDFKEKNIEDVKVGDIVLTRESETSSKLVEAKVIKVLPKHPSGYLIVNGKLKVTEEHVIFASGEWIYAGDLQVGDYMLDENNQKININSIEKSQKEVEVYNLEIEHYRTFFASGFYVHNVKATNWNFDLKDKETNKNIPNASAIMQTRSPYYSTCSSSVEAWVFYYNPSIDLYTIDCTLNSGQSDPTQAKVSISKSGYVSKTITINKTGIPTVFLSSDTTPPSAPSGLKTTSVKRASVTLSWNASTDNIGVTGYNVYRNGVLQYTSTSTSITDNNVTPGKKYTYYIKAYDAVGNISSSSNTISVNTSEDITDVKLPSVFSAKGSKSTNLAKIKDPKKVKNFTVDVVGKSKITFNDILNLSSSKVPSLFKSLDKYIKMEKLGVVEVDTKTLTMLAKKKASVLMLNLPFTETPEILVDGKPPVEGVISNIKYENGILSFDVTSFSKFEAVPKLEIAEPQDGFNVGDPNITLRGKVSDPEATVSAKLNGGSLGNLKVATESGQFSRKLELKEGNNTIVISAISDFGPPLVATVSGVLSKPIIGMVQIIGIGLVIIILLLAAGGGFWLYYKKRRSTPTTPSPK